MLSRVCLIGGVPAVAAAGTPVQLAVSQATAFAVLGRSCGGIQEQSIAGGFDAASGNPTGVVYMQTRCGGSGRGGGYHVTTYFAWMSVTWDFGANVLAYSKIATPPLLDPTATYTDVHGDEMHTTYNTAVPTCATTVATTCAYHAWLTVQSPNAPTGVSATLSGGQYTISWTPDPQTAAIITGSTIIATPMGGTAVIVSPVSGNATSANLGPLAPQTIYSIVVTNTDAAGTSPASDPIQVTTGAATTKPGVPLSVAAHWLGVNYMSVIWSTPANPGDSPIDQYQVKAKPYDAGAGAPGPVTVTVDGSSLGAQITLDANYDWAIKVRAHNGAGWSAWSTRVIVVGL